MKQWMPEEVQFLKVYFKDYPIKEIADELNRSIKEIKMKADELNLIENIPEGFKKCKDCGEIKPLLDFHKHSSSSTNRNCYCKACDTIRRRNNEIKKKLRHKLESNIQKKSKAELLKLSTENISFQCIYCGEFKSGSNFYFDSSKFKRSNACILCEKKIKENREIEKILERGY